MRRAVFFIVCILGFMGQVAHGQGILSLGSNQQGRAWEAVGRLEIGGKAFCTGALIEPDLVLTAAHCLYDPTSGERVPSEDIQFLAGWRNGRAAAYRRVRRAVHHAEYDYQAKANTDRVSNDVALLKLQHPIKNTTITPFETSGMPSTGDEVGVVSYSHERSEAPSLQELCEVISVQDGIIVMSCQVDFGASGSPVFSFKNRKPRIVSIVSAKAEADSAPVSLGVALQDPITQLKQELQQATGLSGTPGTRVLGAGNRTETGAKFVRP